MITSLGSFELFASGITKREGNRSVPHGKSWLFVAPDVGGVVIMRFLFRWRH